MKAIIYVCSLLGLFCIMINDFEVSQAGISWMKYDKRIILDKVMNIEYSHPEGFLGDSVFVCLDWNNSEVSLVSKDSSFIVFYSINNPKTMDLEHVVGSIVQLSFGKDADWKDFVHFYPQHVVKGKFNADTVISLSLAPEIHKDYDFENNRNNYFFNKINKQYNSSYTNCTVLIIQKEGRGFVTMYCFYDEKAMDNIVTYITAIEGTLRYRDNEPELKKYIINEDLVTVCIGVQRQKKSEKIGRY